MTQSLSLGLNGAERRSILALSSIFGLRMLGVFMILPVFAVYAQALQGVTPTSVGFALGVYGITQVLFQIPFGFLSDRFGRKPIIIIGLLLFALGSLVAALSTTINGVILGRALQGTGAVGSVIMALLADLTREEIRTKAMAVLGISIGFSFIVAMLLGPIVSEWYGVPGLFCLMAVFAVLGIVILLWTLPVIPDPLASFPQRRESIEIQRESIPFSFYTLYFGVFVLHASLTAIFLKIPLALEHFTNLQGKTWTFYLPVFTLSIISVLPLIVVSDKKPWIKPLMAGSVFCLGLSELGMLHFFTVYEGLFISLWLFFTAFNYLEASLPSLLSKLAPPTKKGSVLGAFSSAQFLGMFFGGVMGGFLDGHFNMVAIFLFCVILALVWLLWILL